MDVLALIAAAVLILVLLSYNHLIAVKVSKGVGGRGSDDRGNDVGGSQEMSVRAVKAYVLGDYIVVTTVIQKGSGRRSIGEVVIDEPSLLIPLTQSLSDDGGVNEAEQSSGAK